MRKKRKQATTEVVASSRDALGGPPTSWVPPLVAPSPSHILLVTGPHPSADAEGRGTAGLEVRGEVVVVVVVELRVNQHQRLMRLM